jgi:hypothetical protein
MSCRFRVCFGAALILFATAVPAAASIVQVDLELALAVDVSSSIDQEEALLQREGYVAALRHPEVVHAIERGPLGRIAVTYYEWAGDGNLRVVADWTVIRDAESAAAFADRIASSPLWTAPRTSIAGAIDFGVDGFSANGHRGNRQVIDISGDGPSNGMREVTAARDRAVYKGVTINGLAVVNGRADANGNLPLPDLDLYYQDCVVGGFGSFVVVANSFQEFGIAIRRKLISEIAGISPLEPPRVVPAALSRICDYGLVSWQEIFIH